MRERGRRGKRGKGEEWKGKEGEQGQKQRMWEGREERKNIYFHNKIGNHDNMPHSAAPL